MVTENPNHVYIGAIIADLYEEKWDVTRTKLDKDGYYIIIVSPLTDGPNASFSFNGFESKVHQGQFKGYWHFQFAVCEDGYLKIRKTFEPPPAYHGQPENFNGFYVLDIHKILYSETTPL